MRLDTFLKLLYNINNKYGYETFNKTRKNNQNSNSRGY